MGEELGYVHNVSPTKKSKSKNASAYFNFDLQTNGTKYKRAVCFDANLREKFGRFQASATAVKLLNVQRKPSIVNPAEMDIVVNKRSRVEEASNSDINFETAAPPEDAECPVVTAEAIRNVNHGQFVSIKGYLTVNLENIKTVQYNGRSLEVLNDAAITDHTGMVSNMVYTYLM